MLELYAAGGLSEAERREVERQAEASPEIRQALNEACMVMEDYASLYATTPRPELKNRILSQLNATRSLGNETTEGTPDHGVQQLYLEEKGEPAYRWMLVASIALFLLSGWLSFHFYTKWQQAEKSLAELVESNQLLARNYKNTSLQLEQQSQLLSVLRNPDFKVLILKGVEAHPDARLTVYWNPRQQQVFVHDVALPAPAAGKQYQLWALKDGQPIDAGLLEMPVKSNTLQQMKRISEAQAFAVTLEPIGGSKAPTLEQLTAMGTIDS
ncbi:MAG TPA: anti-sigma factor [Pontibacter sp.]